MLVLLPWTGSYENRDRSSAFFPSSCQHVCSDTPAVPPLFCTDLTSESLTAVKWAGEVPLSSMAGFHPAFLPVKDATSHPAA